MERRVGTISRGIRCPIIREGDNLADIIVENVLEAAKSEGFELRDRDVIAATESIVARAQGNYASVDAIAKDVKEKLSRSKAILEINKDNQVGLTLRALESLFFNTKLITNNESITNFDIYSKNNVLILRMDDIEDLSTFINSDYFVDEEVKQKYELDKWVSNFIKGDSQQ